MVQLRPHFGHLDAINEQEKSSARSDRTAESRIREERAEDVNMVIKDTADNENVDMYGGMNETAKLLRAIRDEPWQRLRWIDQEVSLEIMSRHGQLNSLRTMIPTKSTRMYCSTTDQMMGHTSLLK